MNVGVRLIRFLMGGHECVILFRYFHLNYGIMEQNILLPFQNVNKHIHRGEGFFLFERKSRMGTITFQNLYPLSPKHKRTIYIVDQT